MNCAWPLHLGDTFAPLRIERRKIEIAILADAIDENSQATDETFAKAAAGNLFANALAHFANQTFGQIDARPACDLTKEPAVICSDHDQKASIRAGRSADPPIIRQRQ